MGALWGPFGEGLCPSEIFLSDKEGLIFLTPRGVSPRNLKQPIFESLMPLFSKNICAHHGENLRAGPNRSCQPLLRRERVGSIMTIHPVAGPRLWHNTECFFTCKGGSYINSDPRLIGQETIVAASSNSCPWAV